MEEETMEKKETKELTVKEKEEITVNGEQTKPGPVYTPAVDIFEKDDSLVVLADLPGVGTEDLTVDLRDNTLTLVGEIAGGHAVEGEEVVTEYGVGRYYRRFSLSDKIDQEKIDAKLTHGVLRLTLPKVEKAAPRKITVNAA
jgi:HSP20 family molecular chaperone IbpA